MTHTTYHRGQGSIANKLNPCHQKRITTTEAAVAAGRNKYVSKGGITTQDIENTTSYDGDAISVGLSVGNTTGKPQATMNGLGYGKDSDSDSSVTRAGITGIAGNKDITTDNRAEYAGALESVFDEQRVTEELDAQTQITQEFGKEAPKAIGDHAVNRQLDLIEQGRLTKQINGQKVALIELLCIQLVLSLQVVTPTVKSVNLPCVSKIFIRLFVSVPVKCETVFYTSL